MTERAKTTKHEFKAEIRQLLDILVHSLYTSREIFLRELISNASDALDKLRFESNRGAVLADKDLPLEIKISFDEKASSITIKDTGIGLTHDELISNIGTIAKSGSTEYLKKLKEADADLNTIIGKFGVGFYSVFMVAKEVVITSQSFQPDVPAVRWKSDGLGDYEIGYVEEKLPRGTTIEIFLKEDAKEFAAQYKLEQTIKKHSNFISFPIFLENQKVNTVAALWREPKSKITKEQYAEFYKFLSYDSTDPADTIHISVDAPIQFNSLLFIPEKNFDLFGFNREDYGLDLYVRRVLIQHKNKDLLPEYFSFVKGIVDSEDLPLNISRETLQENAVFTKIASAVTAQIYSYLSKKAKDEPGKFDQFWKEHGRVFKMGYTDFMNREKFMELLRFNSSFCESETALSSLEEYVKQMKEGQKEIYYILGPSRAAVEIDPLLEIFRKKGLPVLYLYDPVDEFVISSMHAYKDFSFMSANVSDTTKLEALSDVAPAADAPAALSKSDAKHFDSLLDRMKKILKDKVTDVKESKRLTDSAVCLVNSEEGFSPALQKIMRQANKDFSSTKKMLLVNRDNKLVRNLIDEYKKDSKSPFIENMTLQLFDIAQMIEGDLSDPHALAKRLLSYFEDSSDWYSKKDVK